DDRALGHGTLAVLSRRQREDGGSGALPWLGYRNSSFWPDYPRGVGCNERPRPTGGTARRPGLHCSGCYYRLLRGWRGNWRQLVCLFFAVALSAGALSGCQRTASSSSGPASAGQSPSGPSAEYQSIFADYLHGNLDTAEVRAGQAIQKFSKENPGWGLRFRLLQAEVRLRLNRTADAMVILASLGASPPAQGDLAIKFNLLSALANSRLDKPDIAARELGEARRLAEASHSHLMGELLRDEGLVERDTGHPDKALEKFRQSLDAARQDGEVFIQASDMVDISLAALNDHRFEEALEITREAAGFTRSIGARRQLQMVTGNMGWAYQNLGDFESALANFQEAERRARELGQVNAQVLWLQNAGLASYRLGQLQQARE